MIITMFTDNTTKTTAKKFIRDSIKQDYKLKLVIKDRFSGYTDGNEPVNEAIEIDKSKIDFNDKESWGINGDFKGMDIKTNFGKIDDDNIDGIEIANCLGSWEIIREEKTYTDLMRDYESISAIKHLEPNLEKELEKEQERLMDRIDAIKSK